MNKKQKPTKCCGQNGILADQCAYCPAPRYLPSRGLLLQLGFVELFPEMVEQFPELSDWASVEVWRRAQPSGGYLQVVRGLESGFVEITDNHELDPIEGAKQVAWMKEPYHSGQLIDDTQFHALLGIATT